MWSAPPAYRSPKRAVPANLFSCGTRYIACPIVITRPLPVGRELATRPAQRIRAHLAFRSRPSPAAFRLSPGRARFGSTERASDLGIASTASRQFHYSCRAWRQALLSAHSRAESIDVVPSCWPTGGACVKPAETRPPIRTRLPVTVHTSACKRFGTGWPGLNAPADHLTSSSSLQFCR